MKKFNYNSLDINLIEEIVEDMYKKEDKKVRKFKVSPEKEDIGIGFAAIIDKMDKMDKMDKHKNKFNENTKDL